LAQHAHQAAAPRITKPIFQPVSEKILPAEPTLMVRSRMPGIVISGICLVAVEGDVFPDLVADRDRIEFLAELRQQFEILARLKPRPPD
jgi:hypothetical protein